MDPKASLTKNLRRHHVFFFLIPHRNLLVLFRHLRPTNTFMNRWSYMVAFFVSWQFPFTMLLSIDHCLCFNGMIYTDPKTIVRAVRLQRCSDAAMLADCASCVQASAALFNFGTQHPTSTVVANGPLVPMFTHPIFYWLPLSASQSSFTEILQSKLTGKI